MENYNSFQSIIDAFKAEYVNARNLKKSANSKKRTARNAASFNTRKENESGVLETRLTSIESSLDSTLSTAVDTLDSVRFSDLNEKLADLKGKLSRFDAETERLTELVNINPDVYDPWTSREQQAHQMVRNVLVNAIYEAETAISDLYSGSDYSAVKAATIPNVLTHTVDEVVTYFASLRSNFDTVKDQLATESNAYTTDLFETAAEINLKSDNCIQGSKYLLELKSQLADLLDNGATESDVNAKEAQIAQWKNACLSDANLLKEDWAKFDSFIGGGSTGRFTKIIELANNLEDIYNETIDYRNDNLNVLTTNQNFSFDHYSGYRILSVFSELFAKINQRAYSLLNIGDFYPGQDNEYRRMQIMGAQGSISLSVAEKDAIIDNYIFTENPSTGHYELRKDVSPDLVSKYMQYQNNAFPITTLTRKHAERKAALQDFNFYLERFNGEGMDKITQITDRYQKSKRFLQDLSNQYEKMNLGYWTGTEEQNEQWNTLYSSIHGAGGLGGMWYSKIWIGGYKKKAEKRYNLHSSLFPEFYSSLDTLRSTKESATSYYLGLAPQLDSLNTAVGEAYNLLVTSSEPAEGYVWDEDNTIYVLDNADYATFLAADAALQSFKDDVNSPANNAKVAAEDAYAAHVQGYFDVVGLPMGTYTVQGTTLAGYYNEYQDQSQSYSEVVDALETAQQELQTLEGQMTRSIPTENDKRDKVKLGMEAYQAYQMNMKFEEDFGAGIDTLMYIIHQKISNAKSTILEIDDLLPGLTTEAMAFITGESGSNPLFDSVKKESTEYVQKMYHREMSQVEKDGIEEIGTHHLSQVLNVNEVSLLETLDTNFIYSLRDYAMDKFITYPRSISNQVISEVQNGGSSF